MAGKNRAKANLGLETCGAASRSPTRSSREGEGERERAPAGTRRARRFPLLVGEKVAI